MAFFIFLCFLSCILIIKKKDSYSKIQSRLKYHFPL